MTSYYQQRVEEKTAAYNALFNEAKDNPEIERAADAIATAFENGGKITSGGNGGSGSNADQLIGEFVGRFRWMRGPLPAFTMPGIAGMTAVGNDFGFDQVFSRQVKALLKPGDVFVGYSTSGNSPNILEAIRAAKENGVTTIGFSGSGGKIKDEVDIPVVVSSTEPQTIEEIHLILTHLVCELVENRICENDPTARRLR
ncbi:MAG: SIS domain-containing protein [Chloroflexi bacterium]|jgi:D-sedoheptulose 7-phosphate isomerase|nr:SIS domain-containing protein [Anaerolineaceae bacterium]NMB88169.1 SIS domain-containing protein [Chloroflexota bacterium]